MWPALAAALTAAFRAPLRLPPSDMEITEGLFPNFFAIVEDNDESRRLMKMMDCKRRGGDDSGDDDGDHGDDDGGDNMFSIVTEYECANMGNLQNGNSKVVTVLLSQCNADYWGSAGPCCKAETAMNYMLSRNDLMKSVKWFVLSDDDYYFRPKLFLAYLDLHDWTLPSILVTQRPLSPFTIYAGVSKEDRKST